jgi:hypothetical protein
LQAANLGKIMEEGQWALIAGSAEGLGEDVSPASEPAN